MYTVEVLSSALLWWLDWTYIYMDPIYTRTWSITMYRAFRCGLRASSVSKPSGSTDTENEDGTNGFWTGLVTKYPCRWYSFWNFNRSHLTKMVISFNIDRLWSKIQYTDSLFTIAGWERKRKILLLLKNKALWQAMSLSRALQVLCSRRARWSLMWQLAKYEHKL
jgi:hypothetical protein